MKNKLILCFTSIILILLLISCSNNRSSSKNEFSNKTRSIQVQSNNGLKNNKILSVSVSELYVRKEPKLDADIVTTYTFGKKLSILSTVNGDYYKNNNKWYEIHVNNKKSFIWSGGVSETNIDESMINIDVNAIKTGDFSTLVGVWRKTDGTSIQIINDGTLINNNSTDKIELGKEYEFDGITALSVKSGNYGYALELYPSGVKSKSGDTSDFSKPRLVITQNTGVPLTNEVVFYRDRVKTQ